MTVLYPTPCYKEVCFKETTQLRVIRRYVLKEVHSIFILSR